VSTVMLIDALL